MQGLTIEEFLERFPEFEPQTELQPIFDRVIGDVGCYYGGVYGSDTCTNAIILQLTAHLIYDEQNPSNTPYRVATNQSVGSVSIGYGGDVSSNNNAFFMTSKYGQRYLQLTGNTIGVLFT